MSDPVSDLLDSAVGTLFGGATMHTTQPQAKPKDGKKEKQPVAKPQQRAANAPPSKSSTSQEKSADFSDFVARLKKEIKRLRGEIAKKDEQIMQLEVIIKQLCFYTPQEQNKTLKTVLAEPVVPASQYNTQMEVFNQTIESLAKENYQLRTELTAAQAKITLLNDKEPLPTPSSSSSSVAHNGDQKSTQNQNQNQNLNLNLNLDNTQPKDYSHSTNKEETTLTSDGFVKLQQRYGKKKKKFKQKCNWFRCTRKTTKRPPTTSGKFTATTLKR